MGATAATGNLRDAACGRLDEDDAEALLLEAEPAVAAGLGEHVGAAVERGQVVVLDPADEAGRRT